MICKCMCVFVCVYSQLSTQIYCIYDGGAALFEPSVKSQPTMELERWAFTIQNYFKTLFYLLIVLLDI